jgi:L-threonylcarbamoyladenylate synthase
MVMPKNPDIPLITSGGLDTVGVRMPSHSAAAALINACGVPLAAPSANLSGSPSPTTAAHVYNDMKGRIPLILDGGSCDAGVESTVISFEQNTIKILRPGKITPQMLMTVTPDVVIDKGVLNEVDPTARVSSPGMKYKHYSPKANVIIVDADTEQFAHYVSSQPQDGVISLVFNEGDLPENLRSIALGSTSEEQAHNLFDALREADKRGAKTVYARCPETDGVGLAVYNRLIRAAAFKVVKL